MDDQFAERELEGRFATNEGVVSDEPEIRKAVEVTGRRGEGEGERRGGRG